MEAYSQGCCSDADCWQWQTVFSYFKMALVLILRRQAICTAITLDHLPKRLHTPGLSLMQYVMKG